MIFDSKRTASVKSINYGSLAKLNKSGYEELKKSFSTKETSIERCFKEYMFKYKDDLRTFLEIECDKIQYFKPLSMITKQELLFRMNRKWYNEGDMIFKSESKIDRLILI